MIWEKIGIKPNFINHFISADMDTNETNQLKDKIRLLELEISFLKQQQVEIIQAKELYLKIFEEFPALIWRSRLDKLCDYFNKTWLDFTGRTMEQEFGNGWAEGVHPDDLNSCIEVYVTSFDKREPFLMEYRMKNKSGEYCWIRDFGRPFYDLDNSFLGYIGSCYDITAIKNSEIKLTELNATKDKFFSIIAHDLKNPFNSIDGFSSLLIEQIHEKNYDKVKEYAGIIQNSSQRAMLLLANLMEWSHSQTGRIEYSPKPIEIGLLIDEITELLNYSTLQKTITLSVELPKNTIVLADKAMIGTILRNLVSNAIKFTHPGGKIIISAEEKPDEWLVCVSDNGVGIKPDTIEKLFRIDQNTSTSGTQNESGTGLGLILCKDFVEKHGGKIWVESEVGKGSKFCFTIPTRDSSSPW